MPRLALIAVGSLREGLLAELAPFLAEATGMEVSLSPVVVEISPAYDQVRGQADCRRLLPILERAADRSGGRALGVADVDLFSAVFSFVFGEAKLGGKAGLFSLHRLRPGLYGLPDDPALLMARARKEALHETGHLLGLVHCRTVDCVMRFSGAAEEVDLKTDVFCDDCRSTLNVLARESPAGGDRSRVPPS